MSKYIPDIRQGDTYRLKLEYQGTDLTGWRHWMTLRAEFDDATPALATSSLAGDHPDDDPAEGIVYVEFTPTQTATVTPGTYRWDIQAKATGGDIITILPPAERYLDTVKLVPQVTKDA
jgi:hypothetical protein